MTIAVATLRNWEHHDHEAIRDAIAGLMAELPDQALTIDRGLRAAESVHGNFHEVHINLERARNALEDVRPLLDILWELLPERYTGGASFGKWVDQDE